MVDPVPSTVPCEPLAVPTRLESPRSKLLYLALAATDGAQVSELRAALDVPSPSICPVVRDLREASLVECADDGAPRIADVETAPIGGI